MFGPEIQKPEHPLKRFMGTNFLKRRATFLRLWETGEYEEAFRATKHRYAKTIYELCHRDPPLSQTDIAKKLKISRQYVCWEIDALERLGIPLWDNNTSK